MDKIFAFIIFFVSLFAISIFFNNSVQSQSLSSTMLNASNIVYCQSASYPYYLYPCIQGNSGNTLTSEQVPLTQQLQSPQLQLQQLQNLQYQQQQQLRSLPALPDAIGAGFATPTASAKCRD